MITSPRAPVILMPASVHAMGVSRAFLESSALKRGECKSGPGKTSGAVGHMRTDNRAENPPNKVNNSARPWHVPAHRSVIRRGLRRGGLPAVRAVAPRLQTGYTLTHPNFPEEHRVGKENMSLEKITTQPEFDMEYYMEISGLMRIEQELAELLEKYWFKWETQLKAFKMEPTKQDAEDGFLLVYLDEDTEAEVQAAFEANSQHGFAYHNLAITLVLSAAQSVIPELIGGCMPLPTPSREARKKFKKLGLEWDDKGAMNRTYAVFTPYPYRGGCEVCHSCDTCPSSQMREIGKMEE